LRNSYATYAQTFRSSGDVARAMGDAESTVKRFYVRTLEPGVGKDWFKATQFQMTYQCPSSFEPA
jgi:hypothetical protein